MNKDQEKVLEKFMDVFGPTNLDERFADIKTQHDILQLFVNMDEAKQRLANLICSSMQLASECGWDVDELINQCLDNIEDLRPQYESLGRKTKVALFGGSFNPPHKGHVQFAEAILGAGVVDEVWIVPCNQSRYGKPLESGADRIKMCEYATAHCGNIKVCDWEIRNDTAGETYRLMKQFLTDPEFKAYDFYFAIGMDNAQKAPSWVNWKWLEKAVKFMVVPRKGYGEVYGIEWYKKDPHVCLNEVEIMEVSSSEVRELMLKDDPKINELLPDDVVEYIIHQDLYRGEC